MNDKIRRLHLFLGVFFAPSILFFAVTGTLQTFQFHEAHDTYVPPPAISALAAVHKEQSLELEAFAPRPADARPPRPHASQKLVPLKWFILLMSLGLVASQVTGIMLSFRYRRDRIQMFAALALGTLVPIGLAFLQ
jgi:hypothetical protein